MRKLNDSRLLINYMEKYNIKGCFSSDMSRYMQLFACDKGECVCKSGEPMEYFYFNVKGKLKIFAMMEDGKSLLIRFNKPFSMLGDVELLPGYRIRCNVESLNESHLIAIPMEVIRTQACNDPVFLRYVVQSLSSKLYTISNSAALNLLYPLGKRFASYIVSITSDENALNCINDIKTTNMSELATLLGTSYRHLNRVINEFIEAGIIKKDKGKILILDYSRLKERAGEYLYE